MARERTDEHQEDPTDVEDPQDTGRTPSGLAYRSRLGPFLLLTATALMLVAAGVMHLFAAADHYDHAKGHGWFFAIVAAAQIAVAGLFFWRPGPFNQILAAIFTGGILLLWAITLVAPTPFGEEDLDIWAVGSKSAELVGMLTLLGFALTTTPPRGAGTTTATSQGPAALASVLVVAALLAGMGFYAFGHSVEPLFPDDWVHDHDHDHHNGHDHNGHGDHDHGPHGHRHVILDADLRNGTIPLDVTFTLDVGGMGPNATWQFVSGDGGLDLDGGHDDLPETVQHTYGAEGVFTAVLFVDYGDGAENEARLEIEAVQPEPMQASWTFDGTNGCPSRDLAVLCDGVTFALDDPRYGGLPFEADSSGSLAGSTTVEFYDADGALLQATTASGTIPGGTVEAFLYSSGPADGHTFNVELPDGIPET